MIKDGISKTDKKIVSFLMVGQSNMAGRGDFGEVEPIDNNKCFMLRMGRWQKMSEPINPDRDVLNIRFHSGVCLAASFADEVSKYINKDVGLIPCADGGTSISQWQPGEILFDHAVMMTKLAVRTSEFGGIIWHQGESDCRGSFEPEKYRQHFLCTMTELRRALNAEHLPLIVGEISENMSKEWNAKDYPAKFNSLLHELAGELPNCAIVNTADLALKEDGIHFTSASLRELGKRYFEKYKELNDSLYEKQI